MKISSVYTFGVLALGLTPLFSNLELARADDDDDHEHGDDDDDDGFEGVQDCDDSNKNFTEAFYGRKISLDNLDALPVFEFIDCNHSHFTVSVDDVVETFPLSIYEYNECPHHHDDEEEEEEEEHEHEHSARVLRSSNPLARLLHDDETINCYYALCATEEELEGVDDGGDHEHEHSTSRRLSNYRVLGRAKSDGRGLHDDEKILVTGHVNFCCEDANETVRAIPHHYCSVPEFFTALAEGDPETTEPAGKGSDLTLPIAIGGVAAFALLLVAVAWFSPATEKAAETKKGADEKAAEAKAKGKQLEAEKEIPVAVEAK